MPIANLLHQLQECIATQENATACGNAVIDSMRNNLIATGLGTAVAFAVPVLIWQRHNIASALSGKKTVQPPASHKDTTKNANGEAPPPSSEAATTQLTGANPAANTDDTTSHTETPASPPPSKVRSRPGSRSGSPHNPS